MSFNIEDFGKFKIVQDDGNWVDKSRFFAVVNYWANYFNTMFVSGNLIHSVGERPNPTYDISKKLIAIKGHTSINLLAILFAASKCGHTLYFDNATNLTKAWYKKVKPSILMVGDGDMSHDASRFTSGPDCVRLLFTRRFIDLPTYIFPNKKVYGTHTLIQHKDKKERLFTINELKKIKLKDVPGVAYIEQDTKHQVNQLVDTLIPLMVAGSKIVLHTGLSGYDHKQSIIEQKPDVIYWGESIIKMIDNKEKFINELVPHPVFVPHIRKTKKISEKS
tara:strand:+ start:2130 stop:2960 length:831 start_codon:yes stop_codon:yes gene_type:complete